MKLVSRRLRYDDQFLDGKIPEELHYFPNSDYEYPFFIRDGMLSEKECDALVMDSLANGYRKQATVGEKSKVLTGIRKTDFLLPSIEFRSLYLQRCNQLKTAVEEFFEMALVETGETQTYGYPPSGHYLLHADDSVREYDDNGNLTHWKITNPDRKITTLLFLTDSVTELTGTNQCVGGNLSFDFLFDEDGLPFLIEPKKGTYICFPSNPYFSHRVHEIFEGYRVVIANWYKCVK
jgi:SM-20-related protein